MTQEKYIRVCTRGLIFDQDHMLCAVSHRCNNKFFLPGGGIEVGEDAKTSLKRELFEELGISVDIGDFVNVIENTWTFNDRFCHEINFLFHIPVHGLRKNQQIKSLEEHISFAWYPIDQLENIQWLVPAVLKNIIPTWHKHKSIDPFVSNLEQK